MGTTSRKIYSKEFKLNAIRMSNEPGCNIAELSRSLGIPEGNLYTWRVKYSKKQEESFPGNGKLSQRDEYILKLERENMLLRDERDILKKAAIFFAKDP